MPPTNHDPTVLTRTGNATPTLPLAYGVLTLEYRCVREEGVVGESGRGGRRRRRRRRRNTECSAFLRRAIHAQSRFPPSFIRLTLLFLITLPYTCTAATPSPLNSKARLRSFSSLAPVTPWVAPRLLAQRWLEGGKEGKGRCLSRCKEWGKGRDGWGRKRS